ncbi:hypothetical protein [Hahella sp. HN01]|uniref:hypothetical protein n=1 Tax=unclassified Hahella TaxID=2624107 RepID=UPI001C1EE0C4|nr:hypothetical protein [Hahella sp. HN01]MBU6955156.1 hypothetical protein [Hahella sp. HN01]
MTVQANNGNNQDYSVGLVAVSSWQGWLRHTPRRLNVQQEGAGASNLYRLWSTFSWQSPKGCVGYFKNGHTALVVRQGGVVTHVVGFNPESYLLAGLLQTTRGNNITVRGLWYDDFAMIQDPTAISYEINVTQNQAQDFDGLITSLIGRSDLGPHSPSDTPYFYSFRPADMEARVSGLTGNCGNMALVILCQFLYDWRKGEYVEMFRSWVNQNRNTRNFGQGPLMGAITQSFA